MQTIRRAKPAVFYGSLLTVAALLSSCNNISYVQRNSPGNAYKDYRPENAENASVLGVGKPISERQMAANATLSLQGNLDLEQVVKRISGTYNVAVRWGNGVRKGKRQDVLINQLSFNDARTYIEDVYDVQIIREGERRLLILPSASEPRLASFTPGENVTLASIVKGLSDQCGYNVVITENQSKLQSTRVTTRLKDVTCFDAFEAVLNPQGLSLINTGDYYTVGGLPQRQWTLDLMEPTRKESTNVSMSSDFSASSSDESGGGGASGTSSGTNNITITYDRDLWKDLEKDLQSVIDSACTQASSAAASAEGVATTAEPSLLPPPTQGGAGGDSTMFTDGVGSVSVPTNQAVGQASAGNCGYVRINSNVGTVQMRAPQDVLDEADEVITRLQEIASRRILLEARVLAVTRTREFNQSGAITGGGGFAGSGNKKILGVSGYKGSVTSAIAGAFASYTANNDNAGGFTIGNGSLAAAMSMAEQFGTTTELMHPMIELMDRQRAVLIDGRNEKYFIIESKTDTETGITEKSLKESGQFIGLQFSAAAQISGDAQTPHTISLQVPITSINKMIDIPNPDYVSGSGGSPTLGQAPIANTRLIDQKVRIRDGEIKVIGGLTKTVAVDSESGVPILRDISALGRLANNEGITYEQIEFVVLLQVKRLI